MEWEWYQHVFFTALLVWPRINPDVWKSLHVPRDNTAFSPFPMTSVHQEFGDIIFPSCWMLLGNLGLQFSYMAENETPSIFTMLLLLHRTFPERHLHTKHRDQTRTPRKRPRSSWIRQLEFLSENQLADDHFEQV